MCSIYTLFLIHPDLLSGRFLMNLNEKMTLIAIILGSTMHTPMSQNAFSVTHCMEFREISSPGLSSIFVYSHTNRYSSHLQPPVWCISLFRVSLTGKSDKIPRGNTTVLAAAPPLILVALVSLAQQSVCCVAVNTHHYSFSNKHAQLSFSVREADTSIEDIPSDL